MTLVHTHFRHTRYIKLLRKPSEYVIDGSGTKYIPDPALERVLNVHKDRHMRKGVQA